MASSRITTAPGADAADPRREIARALDGARAAHHEAPGAAMAVAVRCETHARALGDPAGRARALALQGMITLNRGGMHAAFALAAEAEAEAEAEAAGDSAATVEVAALEAQLSFFSGSYRDALRHAERCIAVADGDGDLGLRVYARRSACIVLGNLDVPEWPERLDELLVLAVQHGDHWEEAISRNDLAHLRMVAGALPEAMEEIGRAFAVAQRVAPRNRFALGVLSCTRAAIHLAAERVPEALADARAAMEHLSTGGDLNPYLLGMTVCVEVQALLAAGRAEEAWERGREAVARLGRAVPQARSMILRDVATALHQARRTEEAFLALAESAELERLAFRELTELQREFERAVVQHGAARREAEVLAAKNEELETALGQLAAAHRELADRAEQLEALQAQLREQADRDWLTGLYNRRFLDATLERLGARPDGEPLSLAAVDLDHFKAVNDRFGHLAGDRVLARAAELLRETVRATDVVARSGGEEFVVVMPFTDALAANACAERLRAAVATEPWAAIAPGMSITASIGVVSAPAADDVDSLVRLADRRLYAAKRAGRNRVDAHSFAAA
ncbi:MAG TPA: diguanylate cyclase [Baekduia sp.]|uniref:diguanylate cyclase n=1 Tax=Baekduia sp. TaxID=2600305 RepID=UPI002BB57220|nr:diguanylate cyclase [Baekduia sp.]HMJ34458.1 diguanylate cyclase [Baekduia sp.]